MESQWLCISEFKVKEVGFVICSKVKESEVIF